MDEFPGPAISSGRNLALIVSLDTISEVVGLSDVKFASQLTEQNVDIKHGVEMKIMRC